MSKNYSRVRRATVIKNAEGQQFKLGGYRPEASSKVDKRYGASFGTHHDLPAIVDLRDYMTPVENQGASNSCTANAMAGAYEYLANRLRGTADDVSRLFIYYNARDLDGTTHEDEGTYLKSCIKVLRQYGACAERTWPFDLQNILEPPPDHAYEEASDFLLEAAYRVDVNLHEMRSCLADGYPFAFGLQLFSSFQLAGSNGLVPMPDPDNEQHDGGHAMLCVGYSDPDQVFIVRNSWGEDWGDRGYCYIPYDYMTKPQLNGDCWAVRQVSDVDFSRNIQRPSPSLFDRKTATIVSAIQVPGAIWEMDLSEVFESFYEVEYEEQLVYVEGEGFVSIEDYDLDLLYYQDDEETYVSDEEDEDYDPAETYDELEEDHDAAEDDYDDTEGDYAEEESDEEEYNETEDSYEEEYEEGSEADYTEEEYEEPEASYEEESYEEGSYEGEADAGYEDYSEE